MTEKTDKYDRKETENLTEKQLQIQPKNICKYDRKIITNMTENN